MLTSIFCARFDITFRKHVRYSEIQSCLLVENGNISQHQHAVKSLLVCALTLWDWYTRKSDERSFSRSDAVMSMRCVDNNMGKSYAPFGSLRKSPEHVIVIRTVPSPMNRNENESKHKRSQLNSLKINSLAYSVFIAKLLVRFSLNSDAIKFKAIKWLERQKACPLIKQKITVEKNGIAQ